MAKGPRGENRPANAIGGAIMAAKIATDEIQERPPLESAAAEPGRRGEEARAAKLSKRKRPE